MPLHILELGKQFRPSTSHVYPPFKKGRYMEEFVYDYLVSKQTIQTQLVYIPIFWTNLQNHPAFQQMKEKYQVLLDLALKKMPPTTKYFTIVQHDDGPQLQLPKDTIVFGACTGTIPLPLIYEDTSNYLKEYSKNNSKTFLLSFIGSYTHPIRRDLVQLLATKKDIYWYTKDIWTPSVPEKDAELFIERTLQSKFCLAPRGYGRSSFRFFEAMQLDTIPVYVWDDIEWLPYKELLDYSTFAVSIHKKDIYRLYDILQSISDEKYRSMLNHLQQVQHHFTLEGMAEYIVNRIIQETVNDHPLHPPVSC